MAETHHAQHTISVTASAKDVYAIIEDAASWPRVFPPTIHVDRQRVHDGEEAIRIWALTNGEVRNWTSRRRLSPDALRIAFRQEVSQHPVASLGGEWLIRPQPDGGCEVVLNHVFTVVDDSSDNLAWIRKAMDHNSAAELRSLKATAEQLGLLGDLLLSFDDRLWIAAPAAQVYDFLWRAEEWERRLPHVARVALTQHTVGVQTLEMDTVAKDGSRHTTESIRLGFAPDRIVYKQVRVPALLSAHTGEWLLESSADGVTAISRHTVVVEPSALTESLGPEATLADARTLVRESLGTNSMATLRHAKQFAERQAASTTR